MSLTTQLAYMASFGVKADGGLQLPHMHSVRIHCQDGDLTASSDNLPHRRTHTMHIPQLASHLRLVQQRGDRRSALPSRVGSPRSGA